MRIVTFFFVRKLGTRPISLRLVFVGRRPLIACTLHFRPHFLRDVGSLTGASLGRGSRFAQLRPANRALVGQASQLTMRMPMGL